MVDGVGLPVAETVGDDLLLLFASNTRPTARQLRDSCEHSGLADLAGPDLVEHETAVDIAPPTGISLLSSGLMFDVVGLAPGPAAPIPEMGEAPEMRGAILPSRTDAISLRLGPHIAAGKRNLAILREWFALAQKIGDTFGAIGLCWVPGLVSLEPDDLARQLSAWDLRGEVPVSLLASFRRTLDGALQSHGLSYLTGQELRIEPQLMRGGEDALSRLLFTHLFYAGPLDQTAQLAAPDGHTLRLEPSANGRYVRVWPG
ncbi:MAG: hypothetical protein GW855_01495 [Erythrobacter sp.]|nr:hypothetical protein [Erythrobacter sp.]NCQ63366.1 hypothetical protein [Alphaproteobacteria bacterium]